jgi:hypothetical protein
MFCPLGCLGNENRFQTRGRLRCIQYASRHQEHLDALIKPLQLFGLLNGRRYAT